MATSLPARVLSTPDAARHRRSGWGHALPSAMVALCVASCGGEAQKARGPARQLPPYAGHAAELFDDAIEPAGVGIQLGAASDANRNTPRTDNLLRERTQVGDAVVRARITTVTSKEEDRGRSWQLGLHTLERIGGSGPLDADFTLRVGAADVSSGIVRAFENRLIGQSFVAFVREFIRPGGETELHFHLAPDAKDEVDAVKSAVLLDQVR